MAQSEEGLNLIRTVDVLSDSILSLTQIAGGQSLDDAICRVLSETSISELLTPAEVQTLALVLFGIEDETSRLYFLTETYERELEESMNYEDTHDLLRLAVDFIWRNLHYSDPIDIVASLPLIFSRGQERTAVFLERVLDKLEVDVSFIQNGLMGDEKERAIRFKCQCCPSFAASCCPHCQMTRYCSIECRSLDIMNHRNLCQRAQISLESEEL